MCDIPDLKGKNPREINEILNEYRRKMNSDVRKCVRIITDPHELEEALQEKKERAANKDEVVLQISEKKAMRTQKEGLPDDYVEVAEEEVEEIVSIHNDDF